MKHKTSSCIVILTLNLFVVHYKIVVFLLTYLYQRDEISREYTLTSSKDSTRAGPFLFGLSLPTLYCLTVVSKTFGNNPLTWIFVHDEIIIFFAHLPLSGDEISREYTLTSSKDAIGAGPFLIVLSLLLLLLLFDCCCWRLVDPPRGSIACRFTIGHRSLPTSNKKVALYFVCSTCLSEIQK